MNMPPDPSSKHPRLNNSELILAAPILRWDEALPLGNGEMGCLIWGSDNRVRLSLDRGDLWDERLGPRLQDPDFTWAAMKKYVARKDMKTFGERFDDSFFYDPTPSKIPGGRVELQLPAAMQLKRFHLDLNTATARLFTTSAQPIAEMFMPREVPVLAIRWRRANAIPSFVLPPYDVKSKKIDPNGVTTLVPGQLGYPASDYGKTEGIQWCLQRSAPGQGYALAIGEHGDDMMISLVFGSADEVLLAACKHVDSALSKGYAAMRKPHQNYWRRFWGKSSVTLPDPEIASHYHIVNYYLGSLSRRNAPPIALQGVWTADEGMMPPWKGDYHHDLNTEMTYCSYLVAGHTEEGLVFLDYLSDLMPKWKEFALTFYGVKSGICVPSVMSLDGQALGGWGMYSLSPTNTAWLAHLFARHWRYTRDLTFLREKALPFVRGTAEFLSALLVCGSDGKLRLPLSSSPEIHDNTYEAFLTPNSNYDLALLQSLFRDTAELAAVLGEPVARWEKLLSQLEPLAQDAETGLLLAPGKALQESHRHHAHLMGIYPLNLLTAEQDLALIELSLRHLDRLGTGLWVGYSFVWASMMAARTGNGHRAETFLRHYLNLTSRNGFHLNGDFRDQGYSWWKYRPFTLEGNFMAVEAVHEMLLQSHDGLLRIFPAIPDHWMDVAFDDLRAEGGFRVSARRHKGVTKSVSITPTTQGKVKLADPFRGCRVKVTGGKLVKRGGLLVGLLTEGTCLKLTAIPRT